MGLLAERLNLRLFIDGIEVPVMGAKTTFSEGTVATADIQVVATDEIYDIEPRAFVTLFVYDGDDYIENPLTGDPDLKIGPNDIRRWKLLFSGELVAVSLNKQAGGRAATLSCADVTNYFDFIRQQYINFRNGGVELFESAFMGVKQDRLKFFDVLTTGIESKLYVWLTQSRNADGNASLFLGVQRMLREMFFSVNNFYAEAFNRLRVGDQIVGLSEDETAAALFKLQFAEKFMKNQVGGAGGQVTARQLLDLLLGPVFHSYVTVPCPKFDRKGTSIGLKLDPKKKEDKALLDGIISRPTSWEGASLNATIIKPDTWFVAAPLCNVLFPHQYTSLTYGRNYLAEPTRLFLRTSLIFTGKDKWITERFYAPDFSEFNTLLYQEGGYLDRMANTVLSHEKFVGLNPAQMWQEDLAAYVQTGSRREYFSFLADYLFYKYKFGTRAVNVSGPLNLNLVPGYPAVVIDRVSSDTGITRHFIGHVTTLSHSVDQTGGFTHFNMQGARVHDEGVDIDQKGRDVEEIATRGTDGFLDDRYSPSQIGEGVYQKLFGCGAVTDARFLESAAETKEDKLFSGQIYAGTWSSGQGAVPTSVAFLAFLYRRVVEVGADVRLFTQGITRRPKANFAEMMGIGYASMPTENNQTPGYSDAEIQRLKETDPDLAQNENGFFATAVDPTAVDTTQATYTGTDGNESRYELDSNLKARQEKVLAYVESLRLRGMRG